MKRLLLVFALLLGCVITASADPGTDIVVKAMQGTNWDVGPEIAFLQKTTTFTVPEASLPRLASTENYGGAKFGYYFARDMIKYFEANGYPNLRQMLAAGATDQLDQIAAKYTFKFVYEGPDNQQAWNMFSNYSSLIRDEVFHWGWASKSGEGHFIVTTTPKASGFGISTDGKTYKISNPVIELPSSQWQQKVKSVLDKYGTQANRI